MIAILISSIAIAQDNLTTNTTSNPVKFGLKLGINFAKLTDSEDSGDIDSKARVGVNVGGYIFYKFSKKFAFQPELLYTTQGLVNEGQSEGNEFKITYKLDYIAIPLMFKYYPAKNFNVEFGPQLSFNVSKKIQAKGYGESVTYDLDEFFDANDIDAKTNTFDLGLNFGLGYELDNGFNFGARYSLGMIKVIEGADLVDSYGNSENIKNSVFTFGVGYTF